MSIKNATETRGEIMSIKKVYLKHEALATL